ncbi:BON domain-containing protein [Paraburkholderia sp. MMS20-SJTN17]|uniref:BON domain-containing protein n=1 Tax=Paraburkholderia translucens TaxID=2886945 RepID=A0ABS8KE53_9BURK|nr:BON domain-containing protein [Paraburkholderia sp. MMS20-SJTN17]MCC8403041.1 BON domain-containing protein [Paraburkholderia sp. MMS20-SJTN17]
MKTNGASRIIRAFVAVAIASYATYANAQTGGMPNDASMQSQPAPAASNRNTNRSDSAIVRDVRRAFTRTTSLNSANIHVTSRHGIVTLTGTVPRQSQIARAGNAAKSVRGVRSVQNRLTVRRRAGE